MREAFRAARPLAAACVLAFTAACASTPRSDSTSIDEAVTRASVQCGCRMGIAARHLESGRTYEHLADAEFEGASVTKIAVLTEAIAASREGRVDLADRWTMTETGKADGSGVLAMLDDGLAPTWSDLLTLMIGPSDNTATNAWIARLGTASVNSRMEALGFPHIRLLGSLPSYARRDEEPSPWKGFRFGLLSPHDVAAWYERVARGELFDADSSGRIFAYLDKDPTRLRAARRFPSGDLWAGKSGTMSGVRNDSGILRTKKGRFVLVVFTDGSAASAPNGADHPSVLAIADVSKAIVDVWSRSLPDLPEKPK
ncbi:MAG TPA: serine hydrolase [Thermoanaerobaculia bacterium]|jgi:beta-lactamase class A